MPITFVGNYYDTRLLLCIVCKNVKSLFRMSWTLNNTFIQKSIKKSTPQGYFPENGWCKTMKMLVPAVAANQYRCAFFRDIFLTRVFFMSVVSDTSRLPRLSITPLCCLTTFCMPLLFDFLFIQEISILLSYLHMFRHHKRTLKLCYQTVMDKL